MSIVRETGATCFNYQPGDATRYTIFYCRINKSESHVAIGDGDVVRMGYVVPLGNLFYDIKAAGKEIAKLIEMGLDDPAIPITSKVFEEMSIVQYWMGRFHHIDDRASHVWTATVALLFTAVMAFGNPGDPRHAGLPGSVNHHDWETVLAVIEELE